MSEASRQFAPDPGGPTDIRPVNPPGAALSRLTGIAGAGARRTGADVVVTGVSQSAALARSGDLFAALPGAHRHGADFVDSARARGAVAVLTDPAGAATVDAGLPTIVTGDPRAVLGPVAAEVYGHPARRLAVVGITGTSGKTTTAFLVRAGLAAAGRPNGLLGTIGTFIGTERLWTGLTTPEAPDLQALLAVLVERDIHCAVMEVSSHALALNRVDGTEFALAAFTNLSHDHLDFHPDLHAYFEAKARLFDGRAARHVVVVDDEWGRKLAARLGPETVTVQTVGREIGGVTWTAADLHPTRDGGTAFALAGPEGVEPAGCAIPGRFNVANAALAIAILAELGVPGAVAIPAVAAAQVPGRMERIDVGQDFLAVVDYSHKPAAVEGALSALRPLTAGRLIVVLGCGGDRDRDKRPIMGEVAARGADLLIVTDDNPRSEPPAAIRAAVRAGADAVPAPERAEIEEIGDRGAAIAAAVAAARSGDTVLVAGKGHETGQDVAGVVHPFDDRLALRAALTDRTSS